MTAEMIFYKMNGLEELFFHSHPGQAFDLGNFPGCHLIPGIHQEHLLFLRRELIDSLLGDGMILLEDYIIVSSVGPFLDLMSDLPREPQAGLALSGCVEDPVLGHAE